METKTEPKLTPKQREMLETMRNFEDREMQTFWRPGMVGLQGKGLIERGDICVADGDSPECGEHQGWILTAEGRKAAQPAPRPEMADMF